MKRSLISIAATIAVAVALSFALLPAAFDAAAQETKKLQDTYVLAPEAKLGPVTFSHLNHTTKNRNGADHLCRVSLHGATRRRGR